MLSNAKGRVSQITPERGPLSSAEPGRETGTTTAEDESPSSLEVEQGEIPSTPPTTNPAPCPPDPTTAEDESPSSLEVEQPEIPPTPPTTNPAPCPPDPTTAQDESPSSLEEVEQAEIPPTPPSTNTTRPPTSPRLFISPRPPRGRAQTSNPTPAPIREQAQHASPQPDGRTGSKRKRASANDELADQSESNKRKGKRQKEKDNRVDKRNYRTSRELGHDFVGFIVLVDDYRAWDIATKILQLPVPQDVRKRLVYFCDASIRSWCGAAGIVWPENLASNKWDGQGVPYPGRVESSATVELFAIARTLQLAICEIDEERASIVHNPRVDREFFEQHSSLTRSHAHSMTKEVFVFTDDINALRRIDGSLPYHPDGDMATHLEVIARRSKVLARLGVHVELHLSPGHSRVPGNVAADKMAKKAQNPLFLQNAGS